MVRFNKLGLDKITAGEEPDPSNQVEEVHSYTRVQSAPLNSEMIVYIDIGTAHSVAVTGKEIPNNMLLNHTFVVDSFVAVQLIASMMVGKKVKFTVLAIAKLVIKVVAAPG